MVLEQPLAALAGSVIADRFCAWRGQSGRRYIVSVFPLGPDADTDDLPVAANAIMLAVQRPASGPRRVLWAMRLQGTLPPHAAEALRVLARSGEGECHLHLIADGDAALQAAFADLAFRTLRAPPILRVA